MEKLEMSHNQLLNSKYSQNWKKFLNEQAVPMGNAMGSGGVEGSPAAKDFQLDEEELEEEQNGNFGQPDPSFPDEEEWWNDSDDPDLDPLADDEEFYDPDLDAEDPEYPTDFGWSDEDDDYEDESEFDDFDDFDDGLSNDFDELGNEEGDEEAYWNSRPSHVRPSRY